MGGRLPLVWQIVFVFLFGIPVILVAAPFPRRNRFPLRCVAGFALLLLPSLLFTPIENLGNPTAITVAEFVSSATFFAAILVLMTVLALICFRLSVLSACYAAVMAYTIQNLGAGLATLADLLIYGNAVLPLDDTFLHMAIGCVVVDALFGLFVARGSIHKARIFDPGPSALIFFLLVILVNIVFDMGVKRMPGLGVPLSYCLLFRVTETVICLVLLNSELEFLYRRQIQIDMATLAHIMRDSEAQYELSRSTIEAVNIKMHDIRHQIRHLEDGADGGVLLDKEILSDIAREVRLYDAAVKTGNEALDTILTEKALLGERENISLSCIVDGEALMFMSPADLYALFGNAIENAFEAVRALDDLEKRNISLLVRRVANMTSIHIENYYEGKLFFDADGKPRTTKENASDHGFGMRSMQLICERYGGTLSIDADGSTFAVNMLIPIPGEPNGQPG